jgi:hypothetical protein
MAEQTSLRQLMGRIQTRRALIGVIIDALNVRLRKFASRFGVAIGAVTMALARRETVPPSLPAVAA